MGNVKRNTLFSIRNTILRRDMRAGGLNDDFMFNTKDFKDNFDKF